MSIILQTLWFRMHIEFRYFHLFIWFRDFFWLHLRLMLLKILRIRLSFPVFNFNLFSLFLGRRIDLIDMLRLLELLRLFNICWFTELLSTLIRLIFLFNGFSRENILWRFLGNYWYWCRRHQAHRTYGIYYNVWFYIWAW